MADTRGGWRRVRYRHKHPVLLACDSGQGSTPPGKLASDDIGALPICDNAKVKGMITDRDIVVKDLPEEKVGELVEAISR